MTVATLFFLLAALPTNPQGPGAGEPIMLDFTASWCGPCRQMRPAVEELIQKHYPIKPVDIDRSPELAEKYDVTGVPTFVVIDPADGRELGRTVGPQPAANLASLYNQARAKIRPAGRHGPEAVGNDEADDPDEAPAGKIAPRAGSPNPKPWETVVRIKVHGAGSIGFGSGTIIHSSPDESLILTCAHIFKLERGPQAQPSRFPRKITVDLFDGNLSGPKRNQVHYANETFQGEALDYDFGRDVGLIRMRPGRRLPYARVVPPHWKPKANMAGLITVGCSEGHDATAWNTSIVNPDMKGLNGNGAYEAIECMNAPKQGRSGGGLFTSDGYVAGVCDFAEPQGNHGLYAHPTSIYHILARNDLSALYAPARDGPENLMAKNGPPHRRVASPYVRTQSPDRDEPGGVSLPPPAMVGLRVPSLASNEPNDQPPTSHRGTWHPTPGARSTDLNMDPSADPDRFGTGEPATAAEPETTEDARATARSTRKPSGNWRAVRTASPAPPAAQVD